MNCRVTELLKELDQIYAAGSLEQVERFLLLRARSAQEDADGTHSELIAICNELGSFYRGTRRIAQSISAYERAGELIGQDFGRHCSQYAAVCNNLAGTYRLMRNYDKAVDLFEEALHIYLEQGDDDTFMFAGALNNLSAVFREMKQLEKAIKHLEQALDLIRTMPNRTQETAIIYNNLAGMYYAVGKKDQAMICVKHAVHAFEQCAEVSNGYYATGLNSLAALLFAEGHEEQALELYQKSAKFTLRFFGSNMEYGITKQNMYWVYRRMGRMDEALQALRSAEHVYEELLGMEHERSLAVRSEIENVKKEIIS